MNVQLMNANGSVFTAMALPHLQGPRPEVVIVDNRVFVYRARIGNLFRFIEAPFVFLQPNAPTPQIVTARH